MDSRIQVSSRLPHVHAPLSCDQCRRLKVKCFRAREDGSCNKCAKSQVPCVVSYVRRSKRVAQRARRPRIAVVEDKLHSILDLLSRADTAPIDSNLDSNPSSSTDTLRAPPTPGQDMSDIDNSSIAPMATPPLGLSSAILQYLLNEYRKLQAYFPFVVVLDDWMPRYMAEERPFLLLAAITCSCSEWPHLQAALAEEFRKTLAARVIVNGERDLDLFQGLLVHLAWFHFYSQPRSQQAYQYLQLAISMAVDLSLDDDPVTLVERRHEIFLQNPLLREFPNMAIEIADLEAQRAFLGCHFLSTIISYFLGKPNKLPLTNHTVNCAQYLQQRKQYALDPFILYMLQLQQLAEEVNEAYKIESILNISHRQRLMAQEEHFRVRIEQWKGNLPFDIRESDLLHLRYHAVRIMIHEVGLIHRFGRQRTMSLDAPCQAQLNISDMLSPTFQRCLKASKDYLDCFLATPASRLHHLPFEEWTRLTLALFVVYKLSVGVAQVPEWDPEVARSTCDIEHYLTQVSARLTSLPTHSAASFDTLFQTFPAILESSKASYRLVSQRPLMVPHGIQAHVIDHHSDKTSNIHASKPSGCPGFRYRESPAKKKAVSSHAKFNEEVALDIYRLQQHLSG